MNKLRQAKLISVLSSDYNFTALLFINMLFSILFYIGFRFTWGPDGTNYFLAAYQMFDPGTYGSMSTYYKPLYLIFFKLSQIITPDSYQSIKIMQHFLGFISPLMVYLALRHINKSVAIATSLLMVFDLNTRIYFALFSTEPVFIAAMSILACSAAYMISGNRAKGITVMIVTVCIAMLTRSIATYLFIPIAVFMLLLKEKRAAVMAALICIILLFSNSLLYKSLGFRTFSKNALLFYAPFRLGLINEDTGPYTKQLINRIIDSYFKNKLSDEELQYIWDDIKKAAPNSRNIIFAVGFEEALPDLDDLFFKSILESIKPKMGYIIQILKRDMISFNTFYPISYIYRDYMEGEWLGTHDIAKIRDIQAKRYDSSANKNDIFKNIVEKAKDKYKTSIWSPTLEWPLRDKEYFMYYDSGNRFILKASHIFNTRFNRIINLSFAFLPISFIICCKSIIQNKKMLYLILFSFLIILYTAIISVVPIGPHERYRAPVDLFYFIIISCIHIQAMIKIAEYFNKLRWRFNDSRQ